MIQSSLKFGVATLLLLGVAAKSNAQTSISLTADDAIGTSSFTTQADSGGLGSSHWSDGNWPNSGTNYFTGGHLLRTPANVANVTFPGASLTFQPYATAGNTAMNLKGPSGGIVTMNCTNAGGVIGNGNPSATYTIAGTMVVVSNTAFGLGGVADRAIILGSVLSGTGIITNGFVNNGLGTITYTNNNSAFTGPIVTTLGSVFKAGSQANLGGNPASFNPQQFVLDNGTFVPTASFAMNNANSGVTITPNGGTFSIGPGITLTIAEPVTGPLTTTNSGTLVLSSTNNVAGPGVVGTEKIGGNLTLNGGTMVYDLNSPSSADLIWLTNASSSVFNQSGTTVIAPVSAVVDGTYLLITNAGPTTSVGGSFSFGPIPARGASVPTAVFNTSAKAVTLTISGATSTPATLVWRGTNGSSWDNVTTNWQNGAVADKFYNGDSVTFDDSGKSATVLLPAGVVPGNVMINSFNTNYAFGGSGLIGGAITLTKSNSTTLSITNANNYSGGTYIYGGTVVMDNASALGTGPVLDNASLSLNAAGTVANTITGSGTVAQNYPGVVTLSGADSYMGGTTVSPGCTLKLGNPFALGTPPVGNVLATVASGASLDLGGQNLIGYTNSVNYVSITGTGLNATTGALQTSAGMGCQIGCGVVGVKYLQLAGNASIGDSTGDFQLGTDGNAKGDYGVGCIDGQGYVLTKVGTSAIILEATNKTALSQFIISAGGVVWANTFNNPVGATCAITISNNAYIDAWDNYANSGITLANPFTIGSGGARFYNTRGMYYNHACYNTFSGAFGLTNNLIITNTATYSGTPGNVATSGTMTFSGAISGTGGILCCNGGSFTAGGVTTINTVTLSGANSYTGPTTVNGGVLRITTANQGGGTYTVIDNSTLDIAVASATPTMPASSLTLGSSAGGTLSFGRVVTTPSAAVVNAGSLTINGTCTIIPPAAGYANGFMPLIAFGSISGSGNLVLGTLPGGVVATLTTNYLTTPNYTIGLNVTSSGKEWTGLLGTMWDINSTANWMTNNTPANPLVFTNGDAALFDENASGFTVDMNANLSPSSVTFNNVSHDFTINPDGFSLQGAMPLVKNGPANLFLNNANTFTGGTFINGGTIVMGNNGALNNSSGTVTVTATGALDFNNQNPNALACTISGAGLNGLGTLVANYAGTANARGPASVTLAGSATIGGTNRWDIRSGANQLNSPTTNYTLTKVGTGYVGLVGTTVSPNLGDIKLLGGTFSYQTGTTGLGNTNNTLYLGGGKLSFYQASVAINKNIICSNNATITTESGSGSQNTINGPITLLGPNAYFLTGGGVLNINCPINVPSGSTLYMNNGGANGALTINGPVSIPSGATVNNNENYYGTVTYSNVISGSGTFYIQYQSYIKLAASNTFSGNITVPQCAAGSGSVLYLIGNGSITRVPSIYMQGISSGQPNPGRIDVSGRVDGMLTLKTNQTLRGDNGSEVIGNVEVTSGATLKMANGQYTTVTGNLQFDAGSTNVMDVYCTNSIVLSNDVVNVGGTLAYGGTLVINTNGAAFLGGESFPLFAAVGHGGTLPTIVPASPGPGLAWDTSNLINGGVLGVQAIASSYPVLTNTVSGSQMTLSWPAANLGWQLQSNSVDLSNTNDWYSIPGTASGTSYIINMDTRKTNVFYRLKQ